MNSSRRDFLKASLMTAAVAKLGGASLAFADNKEGLKDHFKHCFFIGAALSAPIIAGQDKKLLSIIGQNFNSITPENALKWEAIRTADGGWKWDDADNYVAFGAQHKMYTVGHTLTWHSQIPDSVFKTAQGDYITAAQLEKKMEEHIGTLVGRYKGKLAAWDVVNEAVGDDGKMRASHWYNVLGEQFIDKAFHLAHEADPSAHLIYNDYNLEEPNKRTAALELIKRLKSRNAPINGIGLQAHYGIDGPSIEEIEKTIVAFADLGLKIHLTELDIDVLPSVWTLPVAEVSTRFDYKPERDPYIKGLTAEANEKLSRRYEALFELLVKHKDKIARVTTWGVSDDASWLNNFPIKGRTNYPLLFDRNHEPKDAYQRLMKVKV